MRPVRSWSLPPKPTSDEHKADDEWILSGDIRETVRIARTLRDDVVEVRLILTDAPFWAERCIIMCSKGGYGRNFYGNTWLEALRSMGWIE